MEEENIVKLLSSKAIDYPISEKFGKRQSNFFNQLNRKMSADFLHEFWLNAQVFVN